MNSNLCEFLDEEPPKEHVLKGGHVFSAYDGEVVEKIFDYEMTMRGHIVSIPNPKPQHSYDCIVDLNNSGKLIKVQVKSSKTEDEAMISSGTNKNKKPYDLNKIDFICIYLKGSNRWFNIPMRVLEGKLKLRLGKNKSKYMMYKDNWEFKL